MKKFELELRVYFEDTDAGGIVYHANYLKFMERARTDWVRSMGISQQELLEHSIAFVVKDMEIKFQQSAVLDDLLRITCEPVKIGNVSVKMTQNIYNNKNQCLVSAQVKIGCVNTVDKTPAKIPDAIMRDMRSDT
ncbi:tol-pal system-associated acyl-CoA thioesterase [Glaciecola sp. 1036]|uniref:tol-pal system-associated acyl-CoA thioesterase n=1 Tax=Alteromonadaceae TaxID=72275 RepID=UPI003CFCB16E